MAAQAIQTIPAIYEDGLLRPLEPLDLPEHTRVQVTVAVEDRTSETKHDDEMDDDELRAILTAAGIQLVPRPINGPKPMTEEARAALMREIGSGLNASGAIIEEREDGW